MIDIPAKTLLRHFRPNAYGNARKTATLGRANLPSVIRMKNPRFKIVFDNANRRSCSGKTPKHAKRMIGSASRHACTHNLGKRPALLDRTQRQGKIGRILMGIVALNLKRSSLGTRLRLLDKAKTALPHSIGIPAKQIARKTGVENGI